MNVSAPAMDWIDLTHIVMLTVLVKKYVFLVYLAVFKNKMANPRTLFKCRIILRG
jgi:Ni,Fe-hydrogenase I cytochrome b subunit